VQYPDHKDPVTQGLIEHEIHMGAFYRKASNSGQKIVTPLPAFGLDAKNSMVRVMA